MNGGPSAVFVYGTLQFDEVLHAVVGRRYASEPARLHEFARYRIQGVSYPGLIPEAGARTDGVVRLGVEAEALARLDAFEGEMYERRTCRVRLDRGEFEAWVWIVEESRRAAVTREAWSPEAFARTGLEPFLARLGRPARAPRASGGGR